MSFFPNTSDIDGVINLVEDISFRAINNEQLEELISWRRIPATAVSAAINLQIIIESSGQWSVNTSQALILPGDKLKSRRNLIYKCAIDNMTFFAALNNCGPRAESRPAGVGRNISQMLSYAELRTPLSESARLWWRRFRSDLIKLSEKENPELEERGWIGEDLSIGYERNRLRDRLGIEQVSNLDGPNAGYDILSWVDETTEWRRRIEVKSSKYDVNSAYIFVTWNEWETANTIGEYEFHLWPKVEDPSQEPLIVTKDQMKIFIPELPYKQTHWKTFIIPMKLIVDSVF